MANAVARVYVEGLTWVPHQSTGAEPWGARGDLSPLPGMRERGGWSLLKLKIILH